MTFKVGDLVCLKSGGPRMTISVIMDGDEWAWCQWFDKDGKLQQDKFPIAALIADK